MGKVLVFHLNVMGSIPTPAMIILYGFYHEEIPLLSPLRERADKLNKWIFSTSK
jgi:hypothetical protein